MKNVTLLILFLWIMVGMGCRASVDNNSENSAQFPNRPVHIIVPLAAGSSSDMLVRSLEKVACRYLEQPIIVTNKTGGGGMLGYDKLVKANADGYTIGFVNSSIFYQTLYGGTAYYYPSALEPLAQIVETPSIILVSSDSPWENIAQVINYAKKQPRSLKVGNAGMGGIEHIHGVAIAEHCDIEIVPVPFPNSRESVSALVGNHIQAAIVNPVLAKEMLQNGQVRALATTGPGRIKDPILRTIPTLTEQGIDFVSEVWGCIVAPKVLPPEVKKKLVDAIGKMVLDKDFQDNLARYGVEVRYLDDEATKIKWRNEDNKLKTLLESVGALDELQHQRK